MAQGRTGPSRAPFLDARAGSLLRFAYLLTGDHGLAEDLLQSSLVRLAGPRTMGKPSSVRLLG